MLLGYVVVTQSAERVCCLLVAAGDVILPLVSRKKILRDSLKLLSFQYLLLL